MMAGRQTRSGGGDTGNTGRRPPVSAPDRESAVYVISVAAQLTGLHPQTLRAYERQGLITPGRTGGGGRRYSHRDIELLRLIADLTGAGIGLEGVRRILDLQRQLDRSRSRTAALTRELQATRQALSRALADRSGAPGSRVPVVRNQSPPIPLWPRRP